MLDRNYNDYLNKGWKEMEAILDKEMPVKKKRWLIPLFLLLGIGLIAGSFFLYQQSEKQIIPNEREEILVEQELNLNQDTPFKTEVAKSNGTAENEETSSVQNPVIAQQQVSESSDDLSASIISGSTASVSETTSESVVLNIASEKDRVNDDNNTLKSLLSAEDEDDNQSSIVTDQMEIESEKDNLFALDAKEVGEQNKNISDIIETKSSLSEIKQISGFPMQEITFSTENLNEIALPFQVYRYKKAVDFTFEAGGVVSNFNRQGGLYAGFGLYSEVSRRWNLQLGLRYLTLSKGIQNSKEFLTNALDEEDPVFDPGTVNLGETENTVEIAASDFDEVESAVQGVNLLIMPVGMNYKINRKLSLGFAVEYSYILNLRNESFEIRTSDLNAFNESYSKSLQRQNLVNRHQWTIAANLDYQLVKNLYFNFSVVKGLTNVLITDEALGNANTLNLLRAGLTYRL